MRQFIKISVFAFTMALVGILQSCSDSDEPSATSIGLEMKATTSLSTLKTGRVQNGGFEFQEVVIGVTELELETVEENEAEDLFEGEDSDGDGEDDNEEVEYEGSFVVDLINGISTPDFGLADIAPGLYEEIEVEMKPILDGGNTMFVVLQFTPDGATTPVTVEYSNSLDLEFEIEKEGGFLLDGGALNQLLILVDLDALFTGIDLNTATMDVDGVIRINSNSNADISAAIEANLENAMEAGEDDNHDGEFDD